MKKVGLMLLANQNILKFSILLIDKDGENIDINGSNWSLTMIMHFKQVADLVLPNFPTTRCFDGTCLNQLDIPMGDPIEKPSRRKKRTNLKGKDLLKMFKEWKPDQKKMTQSA